MINLLFFLLGTLAFKPKALGSRIEVVSLCVGKNMPTYPHGQEKTVFSKIFSSDNVLKICVYHNGYHHQTAIYVQTESLDV